MVIKKEKLKKIAFSLAEAMISMLIISAIATMSIKLFAGQKTKKAADMAHHIMGCYITNTGAIAAMSMEIGKPETLYIESLGPGATPTTLNGVPVSEGIGNMKLYYNGQREAATEHFNYTPIPISGIDGPFCAMDVTETLSSTARTVAMIGGGGFGFMSNGPTWAEYNRPGDSGFFATYTNLDFTRPGIYRLYPGLGAQIRGAGIESQALGDSTNREGSPSRLLYVPTRVDANGVTTEVFGVGNSNVETLAEVRGGYSRNHYYPMGPIPLEDIGCDDSQSCRFEGSEFKLATQKLSDAKATKCAGKTEAQCNEIMQDRNTDNWTEYNEPRQLFSEQRFKNYVTKTVPTASGDEVQSTFAGNNGADAFNDYYKGGTMIATEASNKIMVGMNDLAPRCANDMHDFLKLAANSGAPTIFTGTVNDEYLYTFGTGGACSNYHNFSAGTNATPGKGGAVFVIW